MRRSAWTRIFSAVAVALGLLVYPVTASAQQSVALHVQIQLPATEVDFVLYVYDTLKKNFYSKALDSPALLNASLDGLAKYLEKGPGVKFSPEKIAPGTDEKVAQAVFKAEFGKAESAVRAIKFESHTLAFVASRALLYTVDDSHTWFMDPETWEYAQRKISGKALFAGVGALVRRAEDGSFYLGDVYPDTPADRAGLKRFDKVLAVDGIPVPSEIEYLVSLLRGEKCTEVAVSVQRSGKRLDFKVERNDIVSPVAREEVIAVGNQRFSYFHLYTFGTPEAFKRILEHVLEKYVEDGATGHIIDLRDNPGGRLDVLNAIFEIFLVSGRQCYYVQDESGHDMHTTSRGQVDSLPVVVLVNERSGSASEIFAAVMMEQGRAVVIGTRTAGAVSVSRQFKLPYGSGMTVAVRQFFTAGGRSLEKVGVVPDIRVLLGEKEMAEGRDSQLERAIQILQLQTER